MNDVCLTLLNPVDAWSLLESKALFFFPSAQLFGVWERIELIDLLPMALRPSVSLACRIKKGDWISSTSNTASYHYVPTSLHYIKAFDKRGSKQKMISERRKDLWFITNYTIALQQISQKEREKSMVFFKFIGTKWRGRALWRSWFC